MRALNINFFLLIIIIFSNLSFGKEFDQLFRVYTPISNSAEIEKSINEQIYIIFELPNYKLRVGNFVNRKEAESFQKKIVRLGYRTAWVVPTMIEKDD